MDYKDTLLLPQTDFAMRGNLPANEPVRYKKWDEMGAYDIVKNRKANKDFTLHDGPPYANGHLHIGHALNKILKDIIIKTHYFNGENIRYTPGWDCHGLPIEQQVEVKLGDKKAAMPKSQIREHCRAWASEFVGVQRDEFKTLGVLADWQNPYLTMKTRFEANIYRTLCEVAKNGLLIERSKPVFWSWAARSALAEAEVEYEDKEDYSLFAAFELTDEAKKAISDSAKMDLSGQKISALIWTTTPWTLLANQAISLNPNEKYALTAENLIVAAPLVEALANQGVIKGEVKTQFDSAILERLYAINPLNNRKSMFILGEHVLMDGGSGLVHTAPGHGEDDYFVSLKYDIPVIMPVDEAGLYDETLRREGLLPENLLNEFIGLHIFKANERIVELLGESAVRVSKFVHSYPFCWRTHKPVIYRATKQWFIAMDKPFKDGKSLREVALAALDGVKFYPEAGRKRITAMIENRPDWCISRQRDWGVPIAFFRDKNSGEPVFDSDILEHLASIFDEKGADAWWDLSVAELLPKNRQNDAARFEKCDGILDVWFDSGSTWNAVLNSGDYDAGGFPADMYLEGSDQHRGWFQSSLLLGCAVTGDAPYKSVLTHGFTVDGKGEKMSKSKGNVIAPDKVIKQYGSEILRLWVGLSDYSSDLKISDDILKQVSEQYRKIRNTIRFLLANVSDLEEIAAGFSGLDLWILNRAKEVFCEVNECFKNYDFSKGFNLLQSFLAGDLSGVYLDICKDRLYCCGADDRPRRSAQSAMALIARELLKLIAPTLTYTADEAVEYAPKIIKNGAKSVFDMAPFDESFGGFLAESEMKDGDIYSHFMPARERFNELIDSLKKDKIIKSTLEIALLTNSRTIAALGDKTDICDFFMVSEMGAFEEDGEELGSFVVGDDSFKIVQSDLFKCPRCWKYNAADEDGLCPRCASVMEKSGVMDKSGAAEK